MIGVVAACALAATGVVLTTQPAVGQDQHLPPPELVRITSAPIAGTYVVTWQTLGGCDPGSGTSGPAGQATMRVTASGLPDDTPQPGELTGTAAVAFVLTRPVCKYVWTVSFVEATTDATCAVGPTPFEPDENNMIQITLADPQTACAQNARIVIRLVPALPLAEDAVDHNAILRARFSATARATKDAPSECGTKTAESKIDDNDTAGDQTDDTVSIELEVIATTAARDECLYDVTLSVPSQLDVPDHRLHNPVFKDVSPRATLSVRISVTTKKIYLLQNVVGNSGGAGARYVLETTCEEPGALPLPPTLEPRRASGGIQPSEPDTMVELREGRFNITATLAKDPSAPDAFDGHLVRVLDRDGNPCVANVTLHDLPERCRAAMTEQSVSLIGAPEPTILEFEITCGGDTVEL